jgi:hypothetical protein
MIAYNNIFKQKKAGSLHPYNRGNLVDSIPIAGEAILQGFDKN